MASPIAVLASLFNNGLNNLESVSLGRNASPDVHQGALRLDCLALRLSRWGESVGLSGDIGSRRALEWQRLAFPGRDELELARGLLDDLDSALEEIKRESAGAEAADPSLRAAVPVRNQQRLPPRQHDNGHSGNGHGSHGNGNGHAHPFGAEMADGSGTPAAEQLHDAVWAVCRQRKSALAVKHVDQRQHGGSARPWSLHKHDHFVHIVNSVGELVGELTRFVPSQTAAPGCMQVRMEIERRQRRLAEAEVRALIAASDDGGDDPRLLGYLRPVVDPEDDPILSAAIARRAQAMSAKAAAAAPVHQHVTDNHGSVVGSVYSAGINTTHIGRF